MKYYGIEDVNDAPTVNADLRRVRNAALEEAAQYLEKRAEEWFAERDRQPDSASDAAIKAEAKAGDLLEHANGIRALKEPE